MTNLINFILNLKWIYIHLGFVLMILFFDLNSTSSLIISHDMKKKKNIKYCYLAIQH